MSKYLTPALTLAVVILALVAASQHERAELADVNARKAIAENEALRGRVDQLEVRLDNVLAKVLLLEGKSAVSS